jgi:hypothetical protein
MIRAIVKLAIAALIANAAWRTGSAYLAYYRFDDAVRETVQYGSRKTDDELHARIMQLASDYDLPLSDDGFTISHEQHRTIVDGSVTKPVEPVPGFIFQWPFTWHVESVGPSGGSGPP